MPESAAVDEPVPIPVATRHPQPIALYLFVLTLVALVPAFLFSAVLMTRNNEAQQRVVETLVTGTSRTILQALEREISASITTLRVLATAPALLEGDYRSFHERVQSALEGTASAIYVLDADLMTVMSTRVDYGTPLAPSADPIAGNKALETGEIVVSDVVFGSTSRQWVVNVLQPVDTPRDGRLILGLSRPAEGLASVLVANKLPDGWKVALIDSVGDTIAASPGAATTGEHLALRDLTPISTSGGWTVLKDGDEELLAVIQRSELTGWSVFAWAPRQLIAQPLMNAFWSLLVGGILLAAAAVLVIYWVSLQIGRSVRRLADDARLLGAGETVPLRSYPIAEIDTVSDALTDASRRRKTAETEVRLLMRELAHRSKNQLAVIAAMAKQSAKGAHSVPDFVNGFERRIHSLARSTDLLLAQGVAGVELRDVLSRQIDPLCPLDSGRVRLNGPALRISTQAAQILGMAAYELAANAVEYGAFASESGRLDVSWTPGAEALKLIWRESGGAVTAPLSRRGFGTTVLETMVGRSLGAEVSLVLRDDGIQWTIVIPLSALEVGMEPEDEAS